MKKQFAIDLTGQSGKRLKVSIDEIIILEDFNWLIKSM
jgi:hypothetical protein